MLPRHPLDIQGCEPKLLPVPEQSPGAPRQELTHNLRAAFPKSRAWEGGLRWDGGNVDSPRRGLGEGSCKLDPSCRKRRRCIEEKGGRKGYVENYKMILKEIQEDYWESPTLMGATQSSLQI